jgi:hypothetical protein
MKNTRSLFVLIAFGIFIGLFVSYPVYSAGPSGANVSKLNSTTAPLDSAGSAAAQAGNVSEINIFGYSSTQAWQGYFGNVTGVIQLADSNDNVLYNWTQASPQGEIYASTNQTIYWNNVQCFNFTSTGSYASESGNGGTTSLYGTNITQLESLFGIVPEDVDGVDDTFNLYGPGTHNLFYTSNQQFSEGECRSTRAYDGSGAGVDNNFEEVLLYEPQSASVIFASLLDQDLAGFDGRSHDFEMLVLENGHGVDTQSTTYYFYVELQ